MSKAMLLWLRQELTAIVADGTFGENVDFISFEPDTKHEKQNHYMSTLVFGTITTSDKSAYHVVIKLKLRDEKIREQYKMDVQFHNEVTIYEKIIPFMLSNRSSTAQGFCNVPSLPRFFYGRNRCGEFAESDLIVLENVCPGGYCVSKDRIFLDYDHLNCGLRTLAKFHALSYASKHKDAAGLQRMATGLRDTIFSPPVIWLYKGDTLWKFGKRGIDRLLERDGGDSYRDNVHLRRLGELLADAQNSISRALRPREPHSVVCHGDFNRNNLLFRYDGDTGSPVDTLPVDFGLPRYGSPALDLSFFLYMNSTQTMRRDRWDRLLDDYCATVKASVSPGVRVPDRAALDSEMTASALYGLSCALFFLPWQMSNDEFVNKEDEECSGYVDYGGDAETECVADMVQHFVDMAYTDV